MHKNAITVPATSVPRIVLKLGSHLLTGGTGILDPRRVCAIAEAVTAAPGTGIVPIVTDGCDRAYHSKVRGVWGGAGSRVVGPGTKVASRNMPAALTV